MISSLVAEQRRHWRMSFGLMAAALVTGISVSNERGVFMPIFGIGDAIAATARAFAAVADPAPLHIDSLVSNALPISRIGSAPRLTRALDVPGVTPPANPTFERANPFGDAPQVAQSTVQVPTTDALAQQMAAQMPALGTASAQPIQLASIGNPGGGGIGAPALLRNATGTATGGETGTTDGGTTTGGPNTGGTTTGGAATGGTGTTTSPTTGGSTDTPSTGGTPATGGTTDTPSTGGTPTGGGTPTTGTTTPGDPTTGTPGAPTTPIVSGGGDPSTPTAPTTPSNPSVAPVPEPASWALMIAGFGLTGALLRHRRIARRARA